MKYSLGLLVTVVAWISSVDCRASIDTNIFPELIYRSITNNCPSLPATNVHQRCGYMADIAGNPATATNFDSLHTNLIVLFSTDTNLLWLNWKANSSALTVAADQIAITEFPPADGKVPKLFPPINRIESSSNNWGQLLMWTGDKLFRIRILSTLPPKACKTAAQLQMVLSSLVLKNPT